MERKVSILFSGEVIDFLNELLHVLYEKNYFSYKSSASAYVLKINDFNGISQIPEPSALICEIYGHTTH
jgi:hypothetical protein